MIPGTYLGLHLFFVLPPILLVGTLAYVRPAATWGRVPFFWLAVILALAVVYNLDIPTHGELRLPAWQRIVGALGGIAVSAVGIALLLAGPSTLYLGAIVAWAGPILAIQWAFGWPHLIRARKAVALGIGVPTVSLWIIDRYAIVNGLWTIPDTYTIGLAPFGLPIEEAVFFLMTNVFIVQGLVLYLWFVDQWPTVAPDVRAVVPPVLGGLLPDRTPPVAATEGEEGRSEDCERTAT